MFLEDANYANGKCHFCYLWSDFLGGLKLSLKMESWAILEFIFLSTFLSAVMLDFNMHFFGRKLKELKWFAHWKILTCHQVWAISWSARMSVQGWQAAIGASFILEREFMTFLQLLFSELFILVIFLDFFSCFHVAVCSVCRSRDVCKCLQDTRVQY